MGKEILYLFRSIGYGEKVTEVCGPSYGFEWIWKGDES